MNYFIVLFCVLATAAAKDQKINLEDIERDNLKSAKVPRTTPQIPTNGSPTTYGFVPTRTATDYARQQPKYVNYVPPQQYAQPIQPQKPTQQYYYQQQPQQNLYPQYANIQYVTDNSIAQQQQQQYYTPQYVYLQQYTAPSTAIQAVVDPKGGVQYIMYVPSYVQKAESSQNYDSVINANGQQKYVIPETQYVPTQQQATPLVQYVPETPTPQVEVQTQQQVYSKQEPKSLLDSYVPSILQVQYYKQQQQAQANAIQQSLKDVSIPVTGKVDYVKSSHKPTQIQQNSAETSIEYSYQIPNTQQKYN